MFTCVAFKDSEQLQGLQMSASSGFDNQSREAFLKGVLAAEAAKTRPVLSTPLMNSLRSHRQFLKKVNLYSMTEAPPQKHAEKVSRRTSYLPPSREGTVTITTHVTPELRDKIKALAEGYGVSFNDFATSIFQQVADEHNPQHSQYGKHSDQFLEHTRSKVEDLQKQLNRLNETLSKSPSR